MSGQAMAPTAARNSAMARWYCAPPYSRMCAFGSPSGVGSGRPSGPTNAPVRILIHVEMSDGSCTASSEYE